MNSPANSWWFRSLVVLQILANRGAQVVFAEKHELDEALASASSLAEHVRSR